MFTFLKFKVIKSVYVRFQSNGPVHLLKERINTKSIRPDKLQLSIVQELQSVYENIQNFVPISGTENVKSNVPKGLYIYGSVGGGKTMLMDLFYESCEKIDRKQRIHFNEFMSEVHSNIHKVRKNMPKRVLGEKPTHYDFIKPVADIITESSWLICFDEFQVTDIADAMILKQLFTHLFENGVIVVATSNRSPDDLYRNGLQRRLFLPFIDVLRRNCNVRTLNNDCDYRAEALLGAGSNTSYFYANSEMKMNEMFKQLCVDEGVSVTPKTITHMRRSLTFDKTCGRLLDVNFEELCDRPLGASDYIKIAQNFKTIFIRRVPQLNLQELKLQTRRFTVLIDILYDYRIRVVISSDVEFKELFSSTIIDGIDDEDRILMDDLKIVKNSTNNSSNIFTERIEEQIFGFNRTFSRLSEMQTSEYWMRFDRH